MAILFGCFTVFACFLCAVVSAFAAVPLPLLIPALWVTLAVLAYCGVVGFNGVKTAVQKLE
ncbi:hypothetical protein CE91St41_19590 [Oscillospiraceae bacterium]|nr:hypothetical protein CE91St40_17930 [Oscillospiraceae bacterium]BDF75070.1 hypothetical protein CE91St41_19590 [Oscillospiraceae bacterium]